MTRYRSKKGEFKLSPEEGFVWSRAESPLSLDELCALLPWPREEVESHIQTLLQKAALEEVSPEVKNNVSQKWERSDDRETRSPSNDSSQSQISEKDLPPEVKEALQIDQLDLETASLDKEFRIGILMQLYQLETKSPFDILNLSFSASDHEVKTSYIQLSRKFHPDRYFRKELGPYKRRLDQVFTSIQKAYEEIKNPHDREALARKWRAASKANPVETGSGSKKSGVDPSKLDPELARMGKLRQLQKQSQEFIQNREYLNALEKLMELKAYDPKSAAETQKQIDRISLFAERERSQRHLVSAQELYKEEKFSKAFTEAQRAWKLDHQNYAAALVAGQSLYRAAPERSDEALELLKRARVGLPKDVEACTELMKIYSALGDQKKAKIECEEILRRDPKNAVAARWKKKLD